jgi:hypothetical protein
MLLDLLKADQRGFKAFELPRQARQTAPTKVERDPESV